MMDSLKNIIKSPVGTAFEGTIGILLTLWEWLPEILRICIGVATFIHIVIKIKKDLRE